MNQLSARNQKFYEKVEGLVQEIENNAHADNVKFALENMTALEKCILEWIKTEPGYFKINFQKRSTLKHNLATIRAKYQEIDHEQKVYERDGGSPHRESELYYKVKWVKGYLNSFRTILKHTLSAIEKYDRHLNRRRPTKPSSKQITFPE